MGSSGEPLSMTDGEKPELIWGEIVTGNYFSGLEVHPILGRGFLPEEDRAAGEHPVCVLNYNFWRRHFLSDSNVIGKSIRINGHSLRHSGRCAARLSRNQAIHLRTGCLGSARDAAIHCARSR